MEGNRRMCNVDVKSRTNILSVCRIEGVTEFRDTLRLSANIESGPFGLYYGVYLIRELSTDTLLTYSLNDVSVSNSFHELTTIVSGLT